MTPEHECLDGRVLIEYTSFSEAPDGTRIERKREVVEACPICHAPELAPAPEPERPVRDRTGELV